MRRLWGYLVWLFRPPRKISFTREGWIFTLFTLPVGLAAINTGNNMLYLVLGMLLSIIVLNGVLSETSIKKIRITSRLPLSVVAGSPLICFTQVTNQKRYFPSYLVRVAHLWKELRDEKGKRLPPSALPHAKDAYTLLMAPGETQTVRLQSVISHRGIYTLRGYRLATRFPFGLFDKSRETSEAATLAVYPRPVPFLTDTSGRAADHGEHEREQRGLGGELHSLRAYQPGDDARRIHWKLSARVGMPIVREFSATGKQSCLIAFDTRLRPGIPVERFERAVSHVAFLIEQAQEEGQEVGLFTPDQSFAAEHSAAHYHRMMRYLAAVKPAEEFAAFVRPNVAAEALFEISAERGAVRERGAA